MHIISNVPCTMLLESPFGVYFSEVTRPGRCLHAVTAAISKYPITMTLITGPTQRLESKHAINLIVTRQKSKLADG